jgi:hypothetical protein
MTDTPGLLRLLSSMLDIEAQNHHDIRHTCASRPCGAANTVHGGTCSCKDQSGLGGGEGGYRYIDPPQWYFEALCQIWFESVRTCGLYTGVHPPETGSDPSKNSPVLFRMYIYMPTLVLNMSINVVVTVFRRSSYRLVLEKCASSTHICHAEGRSMTDYRAVIDEVYEIRQKYASYDMIWCGDMNASFIRKKLDPQDTLFIEFCKEIGVSSH